MGRLENKVAVVVGGGQTPGVTIGNGRATALRFAQEGAEVVVLDKSLDSAQETVDMLVAEGGVGRAKALDVTDEAHCHDVVLPPLFGCMPRPRNPAMACTRIATSVHARARM